METRERTVNFGRTNDHCAAPRDVRWHVPAEEGWEIDVNSIKVTPTVISSKSSYSGVAGATKEGSWIPNLEEGWEIDVNLGFSRQ